MRPCIDQKILTKQEARRRPAVRIVDGNPHGGPTGRARVCPAQPNRARAACGGACRPRRTCRMACDAHELDPCGLSALCSSLRGRRTRARYRSYPLYGTTEMAHRIGAHCEPSFDRAHRRSPTGLAGQTRSEICSGGSAAARLRRPGAYFRRPSRLRARTTSCWRGSSLRYASARRRTEPKRRMTASPSRTGAIA
jgi:hypothetical protein